MAASSCSAHASLNVSGMKTCSHPLNKAHFSSAKCRGPSKLPRWAWPKWVSTPRSGTNARLKPLHFARFADAGFNHRHIVMCFDGPHAQRHPQLAVVAQRASVDGTMVREQTRQPLFDRGFAVASRDRNDRPLKRILLARAMRCNASKTSGTTNTSEPSFQESPGFGDSLTTNRRTPFACAGRLQNVMAVVPGTTHSKKDRRTWVNQGSGVRAGMEHDPVAWAGMRTRSPLGGGMLLGPISPSGDCPPPSGHSTAVALAAT